MFRGEQRWSQFMQSHSFHISKLHLAEYPRMVDFASTWNGWMTMTPPSSCRYSSANRKHASRNDSEQWFQGGTTSTGDDTVGTRRPSGRSTMIKSKVALAFTTLLTLRLLPIWCCMIENQTKSHLDSHQARKC
jgi:hypothetical protein